MQEVDVSGLAGFDGDDDVGARRRRELGLGPSIAKSKKTALRLASSVQGTQDSSHKTRTRQGAAPRFSFVVGGATSITHTFKFPRPTNIGQMVASISRHGTTADGLLVISKFEINGNNQIEGANPLPLDMFTPDSTVALARESDYDIVPANGDIVMTVECSALPTGVGDRIDISIGFQVTTLVQS